MLREQKKKVGEKRVLIEHMDKKQTTQDEEESIEDPDQDSEFDKDIGQRSKLGQDIKKADFAKTQTFD